MSYAYVRLHVSQCAACFPYVTISLSEHENSKGSVVLDHTCHRTWNLSKLLHDRIFTQKKLHKKRRKWWLFSPKRKQCEWINITNAALCDGENLHLVCVDLQNILLKAHCFLDKFTRLAKILHNRPTGCKNFTSACHQYIDSLFSSYFSEKWVQFCFQVTKLYTRRFCISASEASLLCWWHGQFSLQLQSRLKERPDTWV